MNPILTCEERTILTQELLTTLKKCKKEEKKHYVRQMFELYQTTDIDHDVFALIKNNHSNQKETLVTKKNKKEESDPFFFIENDTEEKMLETFINDEDLVSNLFEEKENEEDVFSLSQMLVDFSSLSLIDLVELNKHSNSYAPMYFLRKKLFDICYGTGDFTDLERDIPLSTEIADDIFLTALQTGSPLGIKSLHHKYKENAFSSPDEWLVLLIQSGEKNVQNILTERLESFINKIVNSLKGRGKVNSRYRDSDDFAQDAFMGLLNSFSDYKIERKTRFQDFARHVINKHIRTQLNKEYNKRSKASSHSLSYYKQVNDDPSDTTFLDLIRSNGLNPEERLIVRESILEAIPFLTPLERNILILKYHGFSYKEIALVMETNVKGVDNGIQRIHKKGEKYRKEHYVLQGENSLKDLDDIMDEHDCNEETVEMMVKFIFKKIENHLDENGIEW